MRRVDGFDQVARLPGGFTDQDLVRVLLIADHRALGNELGVVAQAVIESVQLGGDAVAIARHGGAHHHQVTAAGGTARGAEGLHHGIHLAVVIAATRQRWGRHHNEDHIRIGGQQFMDLHCPAKMIRRTQHLFDLGFIRLQASVVDLRDIRSIDVKAGDLESSVVQVQGETDAQFSEADHPDVRIQFRHLRQC